MSNLIDMLFFNLSFVSSVEILSDGCFSARLIQFFAGTIKTIVGTMSEHRGVGQHEEITNSILC